MKNMKTTTKTTKLCTSSTIQRMYKRWNAAWHNQQKTQHGQLLFPFKFPWICVLLKIIVLAKCLWFKMQNNVIVDYAIIEVFIYVEIFRIIILVHPFFLQTISTACMTASKSLCCRFYIHFYIEVGPANFYQYITHLFLVCLVAIPFMWNMDSI